MSQWIKARKARANGMEYGNLRMDLLNLKGNIRI
jgi:hypothetical protein